MPDIPVLKHFMPTLRFPPNEKQMNSRSARRSYAAPPPPLGALQSKLLRIAWQHEQLKTSFHEFNSQLRTVLLEAEDVFVSLGTQLMNLVGLKTSEMAAERRFSTIVSGVDRAHFQEENYMNKAMIAGNDLMERQRLQLMQLCSLLRKIEAQVNSSHKSINQNLADHQAFMKKFFLKAFSYVSSVHLSGQSKDLTHMMLKILKVTFDHIGAAFGSVEAGVDELICGLADKMCNPMAEYVNGLKVEMKRGACSSLLEVVREMHETMQIRTVELEEARKQVILAEESRAQALSRLIQSEETARKLTISLGLLTEDTTGPEQKSSSQENSLRMKEHQAKDDNLLWDLLRKKRKSQPNSPLGPNELLGIEARSKRPQSETMSSTLSHRPLTRSQSKRPNLQASHITSRMLLGSSPSATQKVSCARRGTPTLDA